MTRLALMLVLLTACDKTTVTATRYLEEKSRVVMCTGEDGIARCVADGKMYRCIVAAHNTGGCNGRTKPTAMCEPEPPPDPLIVPKVPVLPNTPEKP